jgi:hypothetical protein
MKIFWAFLLNFLTLQNPSVVECSLLTVKKRNEFEKHVYFLIDHIYGEVMISHDGNDLVDSIFERINQRQQTDAVVVADYNIETKTACLRCDWIVMVINDVNIVSCFIFT